MLIFELDCRADHVCIQLRARKGTNEPKGHIVGVIKLVFDQLSPKLQLDVLRDSTFQRSKVTEYCTETERAA